MQETPDNKVLANLTKTLKDHNRILTDYETRIFNLEHKQDLLTKGLVTLAGDVRRLRNSKLDKPRNL